MKSSLVALALAASVSALSNAEWRKQSIYQVLTDRFAQTDGDTSASCDTNAYCGGTFQGIIKKLDYIQDMGFTAIWISPVVTNIEGDSADGSAYHGYWAKDIYSINTNFGSASDLVALSKALHAAGMYLMVDIVTNHMGYMGCGTCVDYSGFNPFNEQSYYHSYCAIDYDSTDITSIQKCWEGDNTVSLPDLATEDTDVLNMWNSWIKELVGNYTIDGLRMDSCYEVDFAFFEPFQEAAGVYMVGEVDDGDPTVVCPYQKQYGLNPLNYPAYYWITQAFQSTTGSIANLVTGIQSMKSDCADTTLLGSFMENHDQPRFASYTSDMSLAKNAIAYTMLADGIPIIYAGQEQHYSGGTVPKNREAIWTSGYDTTAELYKHIASLNELRSWAVNQSSTWVTYQADVAYSDDSTIAVRKGPAGAQTVGVYTNAGASGGDTTVSIPSSGTGFTATQALVDVIACKAYTTDSNGALSASLSGGLPAVFYPKAGLSGSGICPDAS